MTPFLTIIVIFVLVVKRSAAHQCSRPLDEEAACPGAWHERDRYRMRFWQIDDLHGTTGWLHWLHAWDRHGGWKSPAGRTTHAMGNKNVRFEQAGAGEGTLPAEHFDRAVLSAVLGEMFNRGAALTEIFQALKTGAILSVTEGFLDPHHQSWEQVRHLAQAVGFVEEGSAGNRWLFTVDFLKSPTS